MDKMDPELLDRCLRRIQTGQATLEDCMAENPLHAEELEPLLRAAAVTRARLRPAGPSQAFVTHSRKRVMNLARARLKTATSSSRRRPVWLRLPAYRMAGVLIALALLMGSVGVAYASGDALPGDNLYGVKRGLERAALVVSLSAQGDAELLLEQANRRIAEVEELAARGRESDFGPALEGYEQAVSQGLEIASKHNAVLGDLELSLRDHEQVLEGVLANAPDQAVQGLTRALESSRNGKKAVEEIRSSQHPSELAPGQLKKTPDPQEDEPELPPGQLKKEDDKGTRIPRGQLKKTQTPDSQGSN